MAMNDMTFSQAATLLNAVVKQATGQTSPANIATPADLVAVAQTALKTGYDPVMNAVSQVWSRTIFAARDYRTKFNDLEMSLQRYGNAIRKISPVSGLMVDDNRYLWPVAYDATGHAGNPLGNGESVDMYKINKQDVLQTNFYGTAVYEQDYTIFKDQFDAAFSSADEFMRFNAMNMTERNNDRESYRENVARVLQANFIGGIIDENANTRVINVLTLYNDKTGLTMDQNSVFQPENFSGFIRWLYAYINTLAKMMSERTQLYQTIINNKPILRHTDKENLRVALATQFCEQIRAMVVSNIYNPGDLSLPQYKEVNYWQSPEDPLALDITPVYTDSTGAVKNGSKVTKQTVIGVMHDVDALGYARVNPWSGITPLNIKGGYWNETYHETIKTISDNTEKAVVLLLE